MSPALTILIDLRKIILLSAIETLQSNFVFKSVNLITAKETDKNFEIIDSNSVNEPRFSSSSCYVNGHNHACSASLKHDWWPRQKADLELDQQIFLFSTDHSKLHVSGWLNFRKRSEESKRPQPSSEWILNFSFSRTVALMFDMISSLRWFRRKHWNYTLAENSDLIHSKTFKDFNSSAADQFDV